MPINEVPNRIRDLSQPCDCNACTEDRRLETARHAVEMDRIEVLNEADQQDRAVTLGQPIPASIDERGNITIESIREMAAALDRGIVNNADINWDNIAPTPPAPRIDLLWCGQDEDTPHRFPRDEGRVCSTCNVYICNSCRDNIGHDHNGHFCNDCNYYLLNGGEVEECGVCGSEVCDLHLNSWHDHDEDEPEDDYYGSRPYIQGWGREASVHNLLNGRSLTSKFGKHPLAQGDRFVAVELEVEYMGDGDGEQLILPEDCGVGEDGSLSNGIEVTTPPSKGKEFADLMLTTCRTLSKGGYGVKDSCGMHVHVDLRDKQEDKKFLAHMFNTFFTFEDVLFAMQENERHYNSYSIPLRNAYTFYSMYGQQVGDFDLNFYKASKSASGKRQMDSEKGHKYASPRYASFNFHSVYFRGSLECRISEGRIDAEDALKWVDLLQLMVARVEKGAHSYKFMRKMAEMPVTQQKLRAFRRYFNVPADLMEWVDAKINDGQGMGFGLPVDITWGIPVKGQAREYVDRPSRMTGNRVACNSCGWRFVYNDYYTRCPGCDRNLSINGNPRFSRTSEPVSMVPPTWDFQQS